MTSESEQRITEITVLGVLALRGKASGYEIRKWIIESVVRIWEIKEHEVRILLQQLVARGLVQTPSHFPKPDLSGIRPEPGNRNDSAETVSASRIDWDGQVYSLTPAGRAEFEKWLSEPPVTAAARNEFLLKIIFGGRGRGEDLIRHIEAFHREQVEALRYNSMAALFLKGSFFRKHPDLPYWILVNKYGKHLFTAMKDWSEAALATLQESHKTG
jgi:DNA-binding PadR family transcriptional regulator